MPINMKCSPWPWSARAAAAAASAVLAVWSPAEAFAPTPSWRAGRLAVSAIINNHAVPIPITHHDQHRSSSLGLVHRQRSESGTLSLASSHDDGEVDSEADTNKGVTLLSTAYIFAGTSTAAAWIRCSLTALKSHPDPALEAICGLRHNLLTMGQAFCLPLPLAMSVCAYLVAAIGNDAIDDVTSRRLNLGLGTCSAWLGSAALFTPLFSCGYTLYSDTLRYGAAAAHYGTSALCFATWWSSVSKRSKGVNTKLARLVHGITGSLWSLAPKHPSDDPDVETGSDGRNEYALCALLFGIFGILPLVVSYPLATIPAILGRRLSRAASAWTFLAAVVSYCLKDAIERGEDSSCRVLSRGLAAGSFLHVALVALKLAGVDGGGLLLPGDGLWKVYPMMLKAPFAGVVAILTYCLAVFAGMKAG